MGVQVWFARGAEAAVTSAAAAGSEAATVPVVQPEPVPQAESQVAHTPVPPGDTPATVAPLQFSWLRTRSGLLMLDYQDDPALARLLSDIMIYIDWRVGRSNGENGKPQVQQGQFQWPQLQQTSGTPARALAVWLEKHQAEQLAWLGASSALMQELTPWIEPLEIRLTDVGDLQQAVRDAAAKKELWRLLNNSL